MYAEVSRTGERKIIRVGIHKLSKEEGFVEISC